MWTTIIEILEPVRRFVSSQAAFIAGIIIGMLIMMVYHRFIGLRNLRSAYEEVKTSQKNTITALAKVVKVKLDSVKVDQKNKSFFNSLKRYFGQL